MPLAWAVMSSARHQKYEKEKEIGPQSQSKKTSHTSGRKYLQSIYLRENSHPECIKNPSNSPRRRYATTLLNGQRFEQTFFQRRYTSSQRAHENLFATMSHQGNGISGDEMPLHTHQDGSNDGDDNDGMSVRRRRQWNAATLLAGI